MFCVISIWVTFCKRHPGALIIILDDVDIDDLGLPLSNFNSKGEPFRLYRFRKSSKPERTRRDKLCV